MDNRKGEASKWNKLCANGETFEYLKFQKVLNLEMKTLLRIGELTALSTLKKLTGTRLIGTYSQNGSR